jgi:lantibiotic modifying enzyme
VPGVSLPTVPAAVAETARRGAASVMRYLARTAEEVPDGVRWQTLNARNEPHYDPNLYNGVAGISLFLSDYHRVTGEAVARELAAGALRWCAALQRPAGGMAPFGMHLPQSLYAGLAGLGLAWLRLALGSGDRRALDQAAALGTRLAGAALGPWAELGRGCLGEGLFLLRLWEATGDETHLAGARRRAEWLRDGTLRDGRGCHWLRVREPGNPRRRSLTGLHAGSAGIGYFLLAIYLATGEPGWASLAREAADTLLRQARPDRPAGWGLSWPYEIGGDDPARCQWCAGAPGIGFFFARAAEVLGEPAYLDAARSAAATTVAFGDVRRNPSQCHGLSGSAEVFLALYRLTAEPAWLAQAHDFARRALAYRTATTAGETWQADEPGHSSPDFFCGAAGVGHFYLRLLDPQGLRVPFL